MKYLFLDIDGVLNHEDWYTSQHNNPDAKPFPYSCFDPACIDRVNEIIEVTGAHLVISSSWRLSAELWHTLSSVGFKHKFDCTPSWKDMGQVNFDCRGQEIQAYLESRNYNPGTDRFAILDDDVDMLPEQEEQFFQTACDRCTQNIPLIEKNGGTGLTDDVKNAVEAYLLYGKRD